MNENTKLDSTDFRSTLPRFTPEAMKANLALVDLLSEIGQRKKATPAQIGLAWLMAPGSSGLFQSLVQPSCIAWTRTSEQSQSN